MSKQTIIFSLSFFLLSATSASTAVLMDSSNYNPLPVQSIEPEDDVPVGAVVPWPTNKPLPGELKGSQKWLPCDGSLVPAGEKFNRLRSLIGNVLPKYNKPFKDSQGGMFLRGNMQASSSYNQQFTDQTKKHVHDQPAHTHPFDLKLLNDAVRGETKGQNYRDLKRGDSGPTPNSEWLSAAGRMGMNPSSEINELFAHILALESPFPEGSRPGEYTPKAMKGFANIGDMFKIIPDSNRPYGEDHVITSEADVELSFGGGSHCLSWGTCLDAEKKEYLCCKSNVTCSSEYARTTVGYEWKTLENTLTIRGVPSPLYDGSVPGDINASGWNNGIMGWGVAIATDTTNKSLLKNTSLIDDKVVGDIKKEGGGDSLPGKDNRGIMDGVETAPAHIMVRYIIKALP